VVFHCYVGLPGYTQEYSIMEHHFIAGNPMVSSLPMVPSWQGIQEPVIDSILKAGFKQHNQQDTMKNQHVM
jgi:hypothetical protein